MLKSNVHLILFFIFALGLPLWSMNQNKHEDSGVHSCVGECYQNWKDSTGGVVEIAIARAKEEAAATPDELGSAAYRGCVACHGANGEGGVGPALAGQSGDDIYTKLARYKNGETLGPQSALMWSQSSTLSDVDMKNIAAFIDALPAR